MTLTADANLKSLPPKHQQALSLRFQGHTHEFIAKTLGMKVGSVRHWFATGGLLHDALEEYSYRTLNPIVPANATHTEAQNVAERIKQLASPAIEEVARVMHHAKYDDTRLSAAKDILDRAGYMPVQKLINIHAIEEMSINELDTFIGGILEKPIASKNIASNKPVARTLDADLGDTINQSASSLPIYTANTVGVESIDTDDIIVPDISTLIDIPKPLHIDNPTTSINAYVPNVCE